jgi:hypothetical protein
MALLTDCPDTAKNTTAIKCTDQPYNTVFCNLFGLWNESYCLLKVTGLFYQDNYAITAVYSIQNGGVYEEGQSTNVCFVYNSRSTC